MLRKLKIIGVTLAVGIVALAIFINSPLNPAGRQLRGMALAEQHLQAHADLVLNLSQDPRFSEISVQVGTEHDGVIAVVGEIASDDDLQELKHRWQSTNPPVPMEYLVNVRPEPEFSQIKVLHRTANHGAAPKP